MLNKTNILCLIMIALTVYFRVVDAINIVQGIYLAGFWILQMCLRDSNRKIEKASKNPNVSMKKDTSRFV